METEAKGPSFLFVGNQLCLDFINTEVILQGQRVSLIASYADLKAWLLKAGVWEAVTLDMMETSWSEEEKRRIVRHALTLRTTLRSVAEQITAGRNVSDQDIETINDWLKQRKGYPRLHRTEDGYTAEACYEGSVVGFLAPIAESAANLLVHADLRLVRKCEDPQCILYFYDTSKNHARRWCSMDLCGNRHKAAVHYQRSRRVATESASGKDP